MMRVTFLTTTRIIPVLVTVLALVPVVAAGSLSIHLSGKNVIPPVGTKGVGQAIFKINKAGNEVKFKLNVAKLVDVTDAHIHLASNSALIATLFGPNPPSGDPIKYNGTLENGKLIPTDLVVDLTLAELLEMLKAGTAFVDIHTKSYPGGEICSYRVAPEVKPVELSFTAPLGEEGEQSFQMFSGAPLGIRISTSAEVIARTHLGQGPPDFPILTERNNSNYLVLSDGDGCFSQTAELKWICCDDDNLCQPAGPICQSTFEWNYILESCCNAVNECEEPIGYECAEVGVVAQEKYILTDPDGNEHLFDVCDNGDEQFIEFYPDMSDSPESADFDGNRDIMDGNLRGPFELAGWNSSDNVLFEPIDLGEPSESRCVTPSGDIYGRCNPEVTGECAGDQECQYVEVRDGYGLGPDDDLPGLGVFAAVGAGLELVPYSDGSEIRGYTLHEDLVVNNLAGLGNQVAYELNDVTGRTNIVWNMAIPSLVLSPIVFIDCYNPDLGNLEDWVSVDGSPWQSTGSTNKDNFHDLMRQIFNENVITVRAMLFNGIAPETLWDENQDGIVDSADAEALGYELLSNEDSVSFRMYWDLDYPAIILDHNGDGSCLVEFPPGSGGLTRIPR